jgi:hypothetical protein
MVPHTQNSREITIFTHDIIVVVSIPDIISHIVINVGDCIFEMHSIKAM